MSLRHAFCFKFNDYVRNMRVSFPAEKDFTKRVANDMATQGRNLREIPTVMVAIVAESVPIKNTEQENQICQTVEFVARHICGMPAGLDIRRTLIYFAEHTGWEYYKQWTLFKAIVNLFKRFNYAHHHLIKHQYR